jgi:hypothetical protein
MQEKCLEVCAVTELGGRILEFFLIPEFPGALLAQDVHYFEFSYSPPVYPSKFLDRT